MHMHVCNGIFKYLRSLESMVSFEPTYSIGCNTTLIVPSSNALILILSCSILSTDNSLLIFIPMDVIYKMMFAQT